MSIEKARTKAIDAVLDAYLDLPDTPVSASPADFRIAARLIDDGIPLETIFRAIKVAFIRRWARDHSTGQLPPVRSLAYFRRVIEGLGEAELGDDYALYVDHTFAAIRSDPQAWLDTHRSIVQQNDRSQNSTKNHR